MVTNHNPSFESIVPIMVRILKEKRNKGLDLQNLSRLLHENVIVLKVELDQILALESRVGTSHGNDLSLLDQQILGPVRAVPDQLESPELLELLEDLSDVSEAALCYN